MSALPFPPSSRHCFAAVAVVMLLSMLPAAAACKVKAMFVQPPVDVPEKTVLFTGQKFLDIELPQRNLSPAVEFPAGDLVVTVLADRLPAAEIPLAAPKFKIPAA